jgi:hypothetical protein
MQHFSGTMKKITIVTFDLDSQYIHVYRKLSIVFLESNCLMGALPQPDIESTKAHQGARYRPTESL